MKKILWVTLLLAIAIVLALSACGECEHSFGDWTVEENATCSIDGSKVRVCEMCGYEEHQGIPKIGKHVDADLNHLCDFGCGAEFGKCEDVNLDHLCDYGCETIFGECEDLDLDHACDYGCNAQIGVCEDLNFDHACDYGCNARIGVCEDVDLDHLCDLGCGAEFGVCEDLDLDHLCDYGCGGWFGECADFENDGDHFCNCGCGDVLSQCYDLDDDGDHLCEECGADGVSEHVDNDLDGHCYECEKLVPLDVEWDNTELIFQLSLNTNSGELSSGSKRFLAGDLEGKTPTILDDDIKTRNERALEYANVNITYTYLPDGATYAWGESIEYIYQTVHMQTKDSPDFYVNFIYDMVNTSIKGSFANLYSDVRAWGEGEEPANYFSFAEPGYVDNGEGYMYEYMKSLTLTKYKMYVLASDYFIDTTRAFMVVPVDIGLLGELGVSLEELYETVYDGDWNYDTVIEYSKLIYEKDTQHGMLGASVYDRVGFIVGQDGLSAAGLLYSSSVTIINREWSDYKEGDYVYSYPSPMNQTALYDFCDALTGLFKSEGVYALGDDEARQVNDYSSNTGNGAILQDIREKFGKHEALFGGIVTIGSLEHKTYRGMMEGDGFGVVPVPLYRGEYEAPVLDEDGNETGETYITTDDYLTCIHNVGRVGGISACTRKFPQLSAYLHYQSVNSYKTLDAYYGEYFRTDNLEATDENCEMLRFIRSKVGSMFDKTYDDCVGQFFSGVDKQSMDCKWHVMLYHAIPAYQKTDMDMSYEHYYVTKQTYLHYLRKEYNTLPN